MKSCGVLRTRAATNTELAVLLANGVGWLNYQAIAAELEHACQRLQAWSQPGKNLGLCGCCMECHIRAATVRSCAFSTDRLQ